MKIKVIPIIEKQTKKGFVYKALFSDEGRQDILTLFSKEKKELKREYEVQVYIDLKKIYFM